MVEAARRMKAACTAAPGRVAHSSMCTSSGTKPARTISRLRWCDTAGVLAPLRSPRSCIRYWQLWRTALIHPQELREVPSRVAWTDGTRHTET
jgi:hypothetical protein